ncbi:MAG: glycosyltransferase family 39 protein [Terracidiphilus sp.]
MKIEFPLSHPCDKRRRKDGAPTDFLLSLSLRRTLRIALWVLIVALGLARFLWLAADFPNYSPWMIDQAKFTDEGWWAYAAVMHALTGHWHIAGDYNPAAALPAWPLLLDALFHFTGISIVAARALSAAFSLATLGVIYFLIRRYAESPIVAQAAVLLMAASPFAFVFSRLAILDTLVVFEFCAMLLVASCAANATNAGKHRIWPLAALTLLITAALLTKTTVAVLIPAVAWLAFRASSSAGRDWRALFRAIAAAAVAPLALLKLWALFVSWLGYGSDYNYFFGVNAMPDIDSSATLHWLHDLAVNGLWIDRLLYPLALAILIASLAFARRLWRNPLFTASWLAIAGDAIFVFSRQDDYAPRYFLMMLAPVVFIVVLAFDQALRSSRPAAGLLAAAIAIAVAFNSVAIANVLAHRTYQFYGAARDIAANVRADRRRSQLLFGVSAAQVGLIAGLPSINGAYGTEDMAAKVARYKPGWYLAWNGEVDYDAIAGHTLVPVASYRIFDDDGRTTLTLYKLEKQ